MKLMNRNTLTLLRILDKALIPPYINKNQMMLESRERIYKEFSEDIHTPIWICFLGLEKRYIQSCFNRAEEELYKKGILRREVFYLRNIKSQSILRERGDLELLESRNSNFVFDPDTFCFYTGEERFEINDFLTKA